MMVSDKGTMFSDNLDASLIDPSAGQIYGDGGGSIPIPDLSDMGAGEGNVFTQI